MVTVRQYAAALLLSEGVLLVCKGCKASMRFGACLIRELYGTVRGRVTCPFCGAMIGVCSLVDEALNCITQKLPGVL